MASKTLYTSLNVKDDFSISKNGADVIKTATDEVVVNEKNIKLQSGQDASVEVTDGGFKLKLGSDFISLDNSGLVLTKGGQSINIGPAGVSVSKLLDPNVVTSAGLTLPLNGDSVTTTTIMQKDVMYKYILTCTDVTDAPSLRGYGTFTYDGTDIVRLEDVQFGTGNERLNLVNNTGSLKIGFDTDVSGNYSEVNNTFSLKVQKL